MKKSVLFSTIALNTFILSAANVQADPARVSVTRFNQEVNHILDDCRGFVFDEQNQLQTELEHALTERGFKVLERRDIRNIYSDEYELPNLDQKTAPKKGKFLSAQYTITGGITELGICDESSNSGIQLGGIVSIFGGPSDTDLKVGGHKSISKVKLLAQIVSVETGEIVRSFTAKSEINDSGYSISGGAMGVGAEHGSRHTAPIEKASNEAIRDLAAQISEFLAKK